MEILTTDKIDFKLSKEDLVDVAIDDIETALETRQNDLNEEIKNLSTEQNTLFEKYKAQLVALYNEQNKDVIKSFGKFVKANWPEATVSTFDSLINPQYISIKYDIGVIAKLKGQQSPASINLSITLESHNALRDAYNEELRASQTKMGKLREELNLVSADIRSIPKLRKKFMSELTRRALGSNASGKAVLDILRAKTGQIELASLPATIKGKK